MKLTSYQSILALACLALPLHAQSWQSLSSQISGTPSAAGPQPHQGSLWFAATSTRQYRSTDDGATWVLADSGLLDNAEPARITKANFFFRTSTGRILRGGDNSSWNNYVGSPLWYSDDQGLTWNESPLPFLSPPASIAGIGFTAITEHQGAIYASDQLSEGVWKSTDNGLTWSSVRNGQTTAPYTNYVMNSSIASSSAAILATNPYWGIFRSTNQGASWHASNHGIAGIYSPIFGTMYSGRDIVSLQNGTFFSLVDQKLYRSIDNGDHWTEVGASLSQGAPIHLATDGTRLFVFTDSRKLLETTDNGDSFSIVQGDNPPAPNTSNLRQLSVSANTAIYAGSDAFYRLDLSSSARAPFLPTIVSQPASTMVNETRSLTLTASHSNATQPITYQWKRNGDPIPGQTSLTLHIPSVATSDAGNYTLEITNGAGTTTTNSVAVSVEPNLPGYIDYTIPPITTGAGSNSVVYNVTRSLDGTIWFGGRFLASGSVGRKIVKLTPQGAIDAGFVSTTSTINSEHALAILPLPDGSALVGGGDFSNGSPSYLRRVSPTGTLLNSFDTSPRFTGSTHSIVDAGNGKAYIAGNYGIYRISVDSGEIDNTFNPPNFNDWVRKVIVAPDGRLYVAGEFTTVNGLGYGRIVRLNADGSIDPSFSTGPGPANIGFNQDVFNIALQDNGKIVVLGTFTSYRGTSLSRLARLLPDGNLDTGFTPPTFESGASLNAVTIDGEGNILIGGSFTTVNGGTRYNLARLNESDGTLDTSFPGRPSNLTIQTLSTEPDGSILVGTQQSFYRLIGHPSSKLQLSGFPGDRQVNPGASVTLEASFIGSTAGATFQWFHNGVLIPAETGASLTLPSVQSVQTGIYQLVVSTLDGEIRSPGIRISLSGAPVIVEAPTAPTSYLGTRFHFSTLSTGTGPLGYQWLKNGSPVSGQTGPGLTFASLTAADAGTYTLRVTNSLGTTESAPVNLAVLPRIGMIDPSFLYRFDPKPSVLYETASILELPGGKFLAGGYFMGSGDSTFRNLLRLLPDGTVDPTWDSTSLGITGTVRWLFRQSNGKIIVGSDKRPIRLNADLTPDSSFNFPQIGYASQDIHTMILLDDDSLLVQGGTNTTVPGYPSRLFRTTVDGVIDGTFPVINFSSGAISTALSQDTDGGILLAGSFNTVNGSPRQRVARLTPTFTLDPDFTGPGAINAGSGGPPNLNVIARGPDGKVYVAGSNILSIGTGTGGHIFRLHGTTGAHDPGYYTTSYSGTVSALKFLPDHRLIALGNFNLDSQNNKTVFEVRHPNGARDFSALGESTGNSTATGAIVAFIPSGSSRILTAGAFGTTSISRYVRFFAGDDDLAFTTHPVTSTATTPANTVNLGSNTTLTSTALGSSAVAYQWYFNQQPISGATSATLARNPVTKAHEGTYHVVASNQSGTVTSLPMYLDVLAEPEILVQPTLTMNANGSATLTVSAKGRPTLSYAWTKDGAPVSNLANKITGATSSTLTISAISPADAGAYRAVVTNTAGVTTSEPVDLIPNTGPGSVDPSWTAVYPNNNSNTIPLRVLPTPDGGFYLAGGDFGTTSPSGPSRRYAIKYDANGALDTTFAPTATTLGSFSNRIGFTNAAGELFMVVNSFSYPSHLYRYSSTGALTSLGTIPAQINDAFIDGNDQLVVAGMGGFFRRYTIGSTSITQDPDFNPVVNNYIYGVYPAANGYYIAGGFSQVGGQTKYTLARVLSNGSVDNDFTFDPSGQQGFSSRPFVLEAPNGQVHFRHLLLETDGSRNLDWDTLLLAPTVAAQNTIMRGFYHTDGNLYVVSSNAVRRILPNGTLDPKFSGPTFSPIFDLGITAGGKAYIAGNFNGSAANYNRPDAVRLHLENPAIGISQPHADTTAAEGSSVTFTAVTYGTDLTYRWYLRGILLQNGGRISGADTPSVTIQDLTLADSGSIRLEIGNASGSATHTAFLTVEAPSVETFATWSALASLPPDQRGFDDDPDHDGIPNGIEFALSLTPGSSNGSPTIAGNTPVSDLIYPTITFTRRKPLESVNLTVEAATDLDFTENLPVTVVSVTDNLDGTETVTVRTGLPISGVPSQFLRLRVLPD